MAVDPRLRPLLRLGQIRPADFSAHMATRREESARMSRLGWRAVVRPGPKEVDTREWSAPVDGGEIRVRTYHPAGRSGPLPMYVFFHGGGFCIGSLDERDPRCRVVAAETPCVVASVDYRVAPENRFPVPVEDSFAALCWLVEHADRLGADAARVAVGGESAGANLAAVASLLARDRSGPSICHQWLDVPPTDATCSQEGFHAVDDGYLLDREVIDDYLDHYIGAGGDPKDPLVSPLLADDHRDLPPAFVTTCEFDQLRGDGAAYAAALDAAGGSATHVRLAGHIHPSFAFTRLLPSARVHEVRCIEAMRASFDRAR